MCYPVNGGICVWLIKKVKPLLFKIISVICIAMWSAPLIMRINNVGIGFDINSDTLSTYYTFLGSVSIVFAVFQYHWSDQRNRKEKAIEATREWNIRLNEVGSAARKLVDSLSETSCKRIWNEEPFQIKCHYENDEEYTTQLRRFRTIFADDQQICANIEKAFGNDSFDVDDVAVSKLRWIIIDYLNSLESVLVAWKSDIVDRKIIEQEFGYLIKDGAATLETFRRVAGGANTFPAIQDFVTAMADKQKKKNR